MSDATPTDIGKTLQELSTSSLRYIREGAADRLGRLPASSEEVVRALAVAAALDGDADVRSAALQAPVHQAFLKDHPKLIQEATDSATQDRAKAKQVEDLAIMAEYLRRRTRERIHYLVLLCGMLALLGLAAGWVGSGADGIVDGAGMAGRFHWGNYSDLLPVMAQLEMPGVRGAAGGVWLPHQPPLVPGFCPLSELRGKASVGFARSYLRLSASAYLPSLSRVKY